MTDDKAVPDVGDAPPSVRPRLTVVVGLSLLVGVLLTLVAVGGVLYDQRHRAGQAQLRAAGEKLEAKGVVIDALNKQIELLSGQIHALKEHSIAGSTAAAGDQRPSAAPSVAVAPEVSANAPRVASKEPPPVVVPAKAKKVKPAGQDCELVGKSAPEQAATLQRCVAAMDPAKGKARSR